MLDVFTMKMVARVPLVPSKVVWDRFYLLIRPRLTYAWRGLAVLLDSDLLCKPCCSFELKARGLMA